MWSFWYSRNKPLFFVVLPVLASILLGIFVVLLINVLVCSIFKKFLAGLSSPATQLLVGDGCWGEDWAVFQASKYLIMN